LKNAYDTCITMSEIKGSRILKGKVKFNDFQRNVNSESSYLYFLL